MSLHIGIAGPIATEQVSAYLAQPQSLPAGYVGAPLMGVLIGELLKLGYRVSAFTTDASIYSKRSVIHASGNNFDYYICPARPSAWRPNGFRLGRAVDAFAYERQQLRLAMASAAPDMIHAHWSYEFALAALDTGLPHLITCHDSPNVVLKFNKNLYRAVRYLMALRVFNRAKNFTTVSTYMADELRKYTRQPITVVPNPLAEYVLAASHARPRPQSRKIAMICNGWDQRKNPEVALLAFSQYLKTTPQAELHLYGAGFGENQIAQTWVNSRGIADRMFFHGSTPHQKLVKELLEYDVLLHPALEESFGVVIAEAMALGLPIVAGKHSGAIPWVVGHGQSGRQSSAILVDVTSTDDIVAAMQQIFDEAYESRSQLGIERANSVFSPNQVAQQYINSYNNLLGQSADGLSAMGTKKQVTI